MSAHHHPIGILCFTQLELLLVHTGSAMCVLPSFKSTPCTSSTPCMHPDPRPMQAQRPPSTSTHKVKGRRQLGFRAVLLWRTLAQQRHKHHRHRERGVA